MVYSNYPYGRCGDNIEAIDNYWVGVVILIICVTGVVLIEALISNS